MTKGNDHMRYRTADIDFEATVRHLAEMVARHEDALVWVESAIEALQGGEPILGRPSVEGTSSLRPVLHTDADAAQKLQQVIALAQLLNATKQAQPPAQEAVNADA